MKAFVSILSILAVLATAAPAAAQMKGGKKGHDEAAQPKKKNVDEKGYKSALDRIPDQKFDPWGKVR
ncbi:MAG TPA: hypothetical protein VK456_15115 [Xanthobacteraceae bacterium]|nr:hypothetical protein [Xanthobacteraceae bacterium]